MIPHKSSGLIQGTLNSDYAYAVNCYYPNSFRLLNSQQHRILKAVDGRRDLNSLSVEFNTDSKTLERFFLMLNKTEIVSFENCFSIPERPETVKELSFWIHTTNACNLGCSYCYISTLNTGKGMADDVKHQLLYKLIEVVKARDITNIKLRLAGGEPLVEFNSWKDFIARSKNALSLHGCNLDFAFITNLTLLNDDIVAVSKKNNISYGVSLDGIGAAHDVTRSFRSGKGSFEIVDTNIRRLIAEGITVSVNTVVNNANLLGLPDLTEYLIALKIPFRFSIVKGERVNGELLEKYLKKSYRIMERAVASGWQISKYYRFCDLKPTELGHQTCSSGFSGGAIYVDGSFKYCHVQFGDDKAMQNSIFNSELDLVCNPPLVRTGIL